jgi:hypothetical protein
LWAKHISAAEYMHVARLHIPKDAHVEPCSLDACNCWHLSAGRMQWASGRPDQLWHAREIYHAHHVAPEVLHGHAVLRQRACLVTGNDGSIAQVLNDVCALDQHLLVTQAQRRQRQQGSDSGWQALHTAAGSTDVNNSSWGFDC